MQFIIIQRKPRIRIWDQAIDENEICPRVPNSGLAEVKHIVATGGVVD